jgi:hypothetical protein
MNAILLMAAALASGLFLGWLLTQSYATTAMSRSQERMQRKVRYWQTETARARYAADQLAQQLATESASRG